MWAKHGQTLERLPKHFVEIRPILLLRMLHSADGTGDCAGGGGGGGTPVSGYRPHQMGASTDCMCGCRFDSIAFVNQGKHCLLEAELSCVKDLLRREIFPIIIYIKICEKNIKKLR